MDKGFTRVPHQILNQLSLCVFKNSLAYPIISAILRETLGWHQEAFEADMEVFSRAFKGSRRSFFYALSDLKKRNIVSVHKSPGFPRNSKRIIRINTQYESWTVDKTVHKHGEIPVYPRDKGSPGAFQKCNGVHFTPYSLKDNTNTIIIKDSIQAQIRRVTDKLTIT